MPAIIDLIGQVFGRLTVLERRGISKRKAALWLCQCECGNTCLVESCYLRQGRIKSCGCGHHVPNKIYIVGDVGIGLMRNRSGVLDYFWFDTDCIDIAESYQWQSDKNGYAVSPRAHGQSVRFHRLVMGYTKGDNRLVDHRNGDVRDNRRCTLRMCSHAENSRHRYAVNGFHKNPNGTYTASILVGGHRQHLGTYATVAEAMAAYTGAATILFGEFQPYKHRAIYYPGCEDE